MNNSATTWNAAVEDIKLNLWRGIPATHLIFERKPRFGDNRPVYSGIYAITIASHLYIGLSADFLMRWQSHIREMTRQAYTSYPLMADAVRLYGLDAVRFKAMCLCPKSELERIESRYIWALKPDLNRRAGRFSYKTKRSLTNGC